MNSLAVCASIRVVKDVSSTSSRSIPRNPKPVKEIKLETVMEDENEMMAIQTVIKPNEELVIRIFRRGWAKASLGNPFIVMPSSKNYLNPHLVYSQADSPLDQRPSNWMISHGRLWSFAISTLSLTSWTQRSKSTDGSGADGTARGFPSSLSGDGDTDGATAHCDDEPPSPIRNRAQ